MVQKYIKRTDQEWLDLIQECRTSGLTDKEWCEQQHIQRSSFYYQVRRLRKKACEIPDNPVPSCQEHQEVVAIDFSEPDPLPEKIVSRNEPNGFPDAPAIRLVFSVFSLEIQNGAASETIRNTIAALEQIC
jgi:hypothetical protein